MENPASASPNNVLAQPLTAAGGGGDNTIPPEKLQNPNLSSPQIPLSPSMTAGDLAKITSPLLPQPQSQVLNPAAALDYSKQKAVQSQQQQKEQTQPQNLIPPSSMQPNLQQSGSMPRLSQIQQQLGASTMTSGAVRQHAGVRGGQINFGGNQIQQPQQQLPASAAGMARSGMITQAGPLPMPGQTAQHFNLPPQMLAQPRQKSLTQGAQSSSSNSSGQAMQGMQNMGMIGTLGLNPQLRAYGQHRLMQGQIRQQLSQQMALKSAQKLPSQSLSRAPSAAALNTQVSGLTQNGQSVAQTTLSQQQQQWLKHLQPSLPSSVSPPYHIQQQQRQQQAFLPHQLASSQMQQKSIALTQQQISQLVQQPQLGSQQQQHLIPQQQLQQYQQLQQQQQLQSSSHSECAMQKKSLSLMGSQPDTPASGTTMLGSQGIDRKLLGKRKIHDLVVQVDPRGKLDPEVEDLLLEIADDFIDSVTTFACSLAKHRKSSTLETKDVLLHLEKNWNLAVPGYSREEKAHQKQYLPLDIHKNRMEMIRAERHQYEGDITTSKITNNQIINNSRSDLPLKSSPNSEVQPLPVIGPESMHKLQRI